MNKLATRLFLFGVLGFIALVGLTTPAWSQTTYTWNQTGSASWTTATNWTPTRTTPASNDTLRIDGSSTPSPTITNVPTETIAQLVLTNNATVTLTGSTSVTITISGGSGTDLDIASGSSLAFSGANAIAISLSTGATGSVAGSIAASGGAHRLLVADASGITFQSGGSFATGTGFTGNAFGTANLNSIVFGNGSTYTHNAGSNPFGATAPSSVVIFETGSTAIYRTGTGFSASGRAYGNLDFDGTSGSWSTSTTGTSTLTINGDLNIGSGVTWNTGGFSGDITVQGSTTIDGTWTKGAGDGNLGNHDFWGMFTVNGTYNLATTGTTQGQITFKGDLINNGTFTTPSNRNIVFNSEGGQTISGSSTSVFNSGFSVTGPTLTIASGANVRAAAGKTLEFYSDLTVEGNGTLSGADASTSVVALKGSSCSFTLPSDPPAATISQVKIKVDVGSWNFLYFSGIGNYQSDASFVIDNSSTLQLASSAEVKGGAMSVNNGAKVDIFGAYLTLDGASLTVGSTGSVVDNEGGGKIVTKGSTTIEQGGLFSAPLEVSANVTTASGTNSFDGNITVDEGATVTILSGKFLRATGSVTINSGAFVNGSGMLYYLAPYQSFTNSGTISAPAVFEGIGYQYTMLLGNGTWSSLTMNDSLTVYLDDNTTLTNSNVTLRGTLSTQDHTLSLNGGTFVIESTGTVNGGGLTVETQGTFSITQNGTFDETLHVLGGTTTASGTNSFDREIIVDEGATLHVPAGDSLIVNSDLTVSGSITGGNAASSLKLRGRGEGWYSVTLTDATISIAKVILDDGNTRAIRGSASFGGNTVMKLDAASGLELANDLTINGGSLQVTSGQVDLWTYTLTLDGVALSISVAGDLTDTEGDGHVDAKGATTIDQGGTFSESLTVSFGTTTLSGIFNDLQIGTSGNVNLSGATAINGVLDILGGDLRTGGNTLTLGSFATITETAPYSVLGNLTTARVCSTGVNQTFGGMGVEINASGAAPGSTTVTRVTGTASTVPTGPTILRYFDVAPATNSGLNATMVFHYFDGELNGRNELRLVLFKSTDGGISWGGLGGAVNSAASTITLGNISSFSRWTAGALFPGEYVVDANTLMLAHMDETAGTTVNDASGNGNTGTATGTTIVGGRFGKARSFNGSSEYVEGSSSLFNLGSQPFAAEAWIKTSSSAGQAIFTTHHTVTSKLSNIGLYIAGGGSGGFFDLDINNGAGSVTNWNGKKVNDGKWHHVAAVRNGSFGYLYIDGVLDFVDTLSQNPDSSNIFRIGSTYPGSYFDGVIDEMRISDQARYPQEFYLQLPPKNLTATVSGTSIVLSWQNGGGAAPLMRYRVYRGLDSSSVALFDSTALLTYTDVGPTMGTKYFYRATAVDSTAFEGGKSYASFATVNYPAPTLTSISPTSGTKGTTLNVNFTGTGFVSGVTTVYLDTSITVNSVSVSSSTSLTANITISAGTSSGARNVSVTNPSPGGGTGTLPSAFNVIAGNPIPTLSSIAPTTVGLGATANIVLTGTGFANGISTPSFGGDITVNSFTVNSPTQITANITVSSSASLGARNVSVTNVPPGGGTGTLTNGLTLEYPAPAIGSITPNSASRGQTLAVTIIGEGYFSGITTVNFGPNVIVNSMSISSTTQLTANITIGAAASTGLRSVTVSNSSPGGGSTTWENAFTINNPTPALSSVSPTSGSRGQTLTVVLRGSNFVSGLSTVSFGPDITVNSTTVDSASKMTVGITIGPGAATGSRDVTVTHPAPGGGTATLAGGFAVGNPSPTLASVTPTIAGRGETINVTLTGLNFINGVSSASFGAGITVNSTAVNSATQMTVNITIGADAALGSRDVTVNNTAPGGGTSTLSGGFTVNNPAPTLASITPTSGNRGQTLSVTVTGTNFIPGVTTPAYGSGITVNSVSSFTSTQVTASVTIDVGATPGPRDITVTNAAPGGGSATLSGAFTVTNPSPTLTSILPNRAGRGSRINVVVTGTNFLDGVSSASFGSDVTVNSTTITSATQITVNISVALSAATGARNVSVTNATPGGGTATLTGGFTVDTSPATSVENTLSAIPEEYVLQEAYPNPFNPSTRIRYGLPEQSRVKLEVYNMLGNVVAELVSGERSKGLYEVEWRAENLPSGVYLVRVFSESVETSKRFIASRKVVLVK